MHVSDPHAKRWLADDPNFLASIGDLDQGLSAGGQVGDGGVDQQVLPSAVAPLPASAAAPAHPLKARAAVPVTPARPVPPPPPAPLVPPGTFGDAAADADDGAAFARPPAAASRVRRPLLDLFPPSALEAERPPPPAIGTAVGPQLP